MAADLSGMSPEDALAYLSSQLNVIATSAAQAKARGDTADLANLLALYNTLRQQAADLTGEVNQAEQPAAFLVALSAFSDQATQIGSQVFGGIAGTLGALPLLLVGVLIVAGIGLYKGSLSVRR